MKIITIELGAKLAEEFAFVDIETRKVPVPSGFRHILPSGYTMKLRWQTFMIGLAIDDKLFIAYGGEEELIEWFAEKVIGRTVCYVSNNGFDAKVLSGIFTNARSPNLKKNGPWPHCPDGIKWLQIRSKDTYGFADRPFDILSKDVPGAWEDGDHEVVIVHCVKDVFECFWAAQDAFDVIVPESLADPMNDIYQNWRPNV